MEYARACCPPGIENLLSDEWIFFGFTFGKKSLKVGILRWDFELASVDSALLDKSIYFPKPSAF
jgi:hypothetical protein